MYGFNECISKIIHNILYPVTIALKIKNHVIAFLTLIKPWVSIERITWCKINIENIQ